MVIRCPSIVDELSCNAEIVLVIFLADNISILGDLPLPIPVLEKGRVTCLLSSLDLGP